MFCPNCGQENPAEDKFCMYCGAELIDNQNFPDNSTVTMKQALHALWDGAVGGFRKVKAVCKQHPQIAIPVIGIAGCCVCLSIANATVLSGKHTATKYFLAVMNNDGPAVYNYLDLPESDFVRLSTFNEYFKTLGYKDLNIGNYQVTEARSSLFGVDGEAGSITTDYNITYYLRGDNSTRTMTVRVVNIPQALGLINYYKVISDCVATDYEINVPSGSTVTVGDITLSDPVEYADCDSYTIPSLYCQDYDITVTHPFGAEEATIHPTSGSSYNNVFNCNSLTYNTATTDALFAQALAQLNSILTSAVTRQDFPTDITCTQDADMQSDIQDTYDYLRANLYDTSSDTGYTSIQITDTTDDSDLQEFSVDEMTYQCSIDFSYNYTRRRKNWNDEVQMQNDSSYGNATLYYTYENGAWTLTGFNCYY